MSYVWRRCPLRHVCCWCGCRSGILKHIPSAHALVTVKERANFTADIATDSAMGNNVETNPVQGGCIGAEFHHVLNEFSIHCGLPPADVSDPDKSGIQVDNGVAAGEIFIDFGKRTLAKLLGTFSHAHNARDAIENSLNVATGVAGNMTVGEGKVVDTVRNNAANGAHAALPLGLNEHRRTTFKGRGHQPR